MFYNIIKANKTRDVVAICDSELIEQCFEQEQMQLWVKENFYKSKPEQEPASKQEIIEVMKDMKIEDATFNIVGEKSVALALELGLISEEEISEIQGIKFALVLL